MAKPSRRARRTPGPTPEPLPPAPVHPLDSSRTVWGRASSPAFILVLALLVYVPTLGNDFVYDDVLLVVRNRLVTSLRQLPTLLATSYFAGYFQTLYPTHKTRGGSVYRPLVTISFALNYAVGGLKPFGYHAINLFLHAGVSLAVYGLGRRLFLTRGGATVAAALFAVHPLHTEAVAAIVGRAELLMALGVLVALYGYLRDGVLSRLGSLVAFAVGLLAKEQAVVLPALLLLAEFCTRRLKAKESRRFSLAGLLPYAALLGAYLLLRAWVLGGVLGGPATMASPFLDNPLVYAPLGPRLLTALAVAGRYLMLCLWPSHLSPDYSYNQIPLAHSIVDGHVVLAVFLLGGLLAVGVCSCTRGKGVAGFAVGFAFLTFLPASNLIVPVGTIMGERLFYLPSAGLCWLAGLGWQAAQVWTDWARIRKVAWATLGVLFLALAAQTHRYSRIWRDNPTLFSYGVTVAPWSAKVHYNLGIYAKDPEEGLQEFGEAARIYPDLLAGNAAFNLNLGVRLLQTERIEDAIKAFDRAVGLAPDLKDAHFNLGLAYAKQGQWERAGAAYRQALALDRGEATYHNGLSFVLRRQGRYDEGLSAADEAIRLNPALVEPYLNRARALEALGRLREATGAYERALTIEPDLPALRERLDRLRTGADG